MEEKVMEEISKPMIPIVIEVKSILDMIEACPNGMIMHKKLLHHIYYFYISLGETLVVMMVYKTEKPFKRYVGNPKGTMLEADEPNSDCFTPIIEVNCDPILELSLIGEGEDGRNLENMS